MKPVRDRTGHRYGMLTVIGYAGRNEAGKMLWRCRYDCGNEVLRTASTFHPDRNSNCGCVGKKGAEGMPSHNYAVESLCWTCIRSAAPPILQCVRDKTKGERLPEGAECDIQKINTGYKVTVTSCPEYLPMTDKNNMELLEQERKKNNIRLAKELGERALVVGSYSHGEVVKL